MNAYLAIQLEAQARLGRILGIDEDICAGFKRRARELVERIILRFWDGNRWIAFNSNTKEVAYTKSLPLFAALILGKRLPRYIIDKSIEYIMECGFMTPYGLASESTESEHFFHGWCKGCINTPIQLIFCLAFDACGRPELAKDLAMKYLDTLRRTGLYHMHNPLTGEAERDAVGNTSISEKYLFWSSWAASCYLFLAQRYGA